MTFHEVLESTKGVLLEHESLGTDLQSVGEKKHTVRRIVFRRAQWLSIGREKSP